MSFHFMFSERFPNPLSGYLQVGPRGGIRALTRLSESINVGSALRRASSPLWDLSLGAMRFAVRFAPTVRLERVAFANEFKILESFDEHFSGKRGRASPKSSRFR